MTHRAKVQTQDNVNLRMMEIAGLLLILGADSSTNLLNSALFESTDLLVQSMERLPDRQIHIQHHDPPTLRDELVRSVAMEKICNLLSGVFLKVGRLWNTCFSRCAVGRRTQTSSKLQPGKVPVFEQC